MDNYDKYLTKYAGEPNEPLLRSVKEKKDGTVVFRVPIQRDKKTIIITGIMLLLFLIISLYIYQNILFEYLDDNYGGFLYEHVLFIVCLTWGFYSAGWLNSYKIVLCQKFKWLTIEFKDENHLLETIRRNAYNRGFTYERYINTFDVEKNYYRPKPGPIEVPLEEKLWVFTRIDSCNTVEFPEEKIAIYRTPYYNAEVVYDNTGINVRAKDLYCDVVRLFLGKKEYTRSQQNPSNPINTILIIVVDRMDIVLENLLIQFHLNSVLFCVISLEEPTKLYIGTDLRKSQNDDYRERIKDLIDLLEIKDINEEYIYKNYGKNTIK